MQHQKAKRRAIHFLANITFLLLPFAAAQAATFTVDSATDAVDANPGDGVCQSAGGQCTLRAAIQEANSLPGLDTVNIPKGRYNLTLWGPGEDNAVTGDLDIKDTVLIAGSYEAANKYTVALQTAAQPQWSDGTDATIINGNYPDYCAGNVQCNTNGTTDETKWDRVFQVHGTAQLYLYDTVIRAGAVTNGNGGAIHNAAGFVLAYNSVFFNNHTTYSSATGPEATRGGAIYSTGPSYNLVVVNSIFDTNWQAGSDSDCTVLSCLQGANPWGGGAIYHGGGITTIKGTEFKNNAAWGQGGAIYNALGNIANIYNSRFTNNGAVFSGGGSAIANLIGEINVIGSIISDNWGAAYSCGGGVFNISGSVHIAYSEISNNARDPIYTLGGGLCNFDTMDVAYSTISGNRAVQGGGIYNAGSGVAGDGAQGSGGTSYTQTNASGRLTLLNTTVSGNQAGQSWGRTRDATPADGAGLGGGIHNRGVMKLVNSTVANNMADGSGAGIYQFNEQGVFTSTNNNPAPGNNSDIWGSGSGGGLAIAKNAIVANNSLVYFGGQTAGEDDFYAPWQIRNILQTQDCFAPIDSEAQLQTDGYNISSDNSCRFSAATDRVDTDPLLEPLADHGQPLFDVSGGYVPILQVHALAAGSPAIDNGDGGECPYDPALGRQLDGRVFERTDSLCDIGAYEVGAVQLPAANINLQIDILSPFGVVRAISVNSSGTTTYTITVSNHGPSDATRVLLTSRFEYGAVESVSTEDTGVTCQTLSSTHISCIRETMAIGTSFDVVITALPTGSGEMAINSEVSSNEIDPFPFGNILGAALDTARRISSVSSGGGLFDWFALAICGLMAINSRRSRLI